MRSKILIYRDYGCADVHLLYKELVSYYRNEDVDVFFTDAAGIKEGILGKDVKAFFLGGGAATPYMEKLAGEANERIRSYVDRGGVYFGICAGAYYACRRIVFEKDIEALHIESRCGLNLVEGEAIGTFDTCKQTGLFVYLIPENLYRIQIVQPTTFPHIRFAFFSFHKRTRNSLCSRSNFGNCGVCCCGILPNRHIK